MDLYYGPGDTTFDWHTARIMGFAEAQTDSLRHSVQSPDVVNSPHVSHSSGSVQTGFPLFPSAPDERHPIQG